MNGGAFFVSQISFGWEIIKQKNGCNDWVFIEAPFDRRNYLPGSIGVFDWCSVRRLIMKAVVVLKNITRNLTKVAPATK